MAKQGIETHFRIPKVNFLHLFYLTGLNILEQEPIYLLVAL